MEDGANDAGRENSPTARNIRFVAAWVVVVLLLYVAGALAGARLLGQYKTAAEQVRQAKLASPTLDLTVPLPGTETLEKGKPVAILVGISVRRVAALAPKEQAWTGDFNIGFRWPAGAIRQPAEVFRIINAEVQQQEKVQSAARGAEHYEEYHVVARITKPFDGTRFPLADEVLLIQVEAPAQPGLVLRYVADAKHSYVGPESMPPNVRLIESLATARLLAYRSEGKVKTHSQFVFAMQVVPNSVSLYLKLFQALYASVAIALVALYIKPIHLDARFGMPVGAFFASVSNIVAMEPFLPPANRLALTDMVNLAGMVTIFLVMVQSVISLYLYDTLGRERSSRLFDRISFALLLFGYAALNLTLPLAASSG